MITLKKLINWYRIRKFKDPVRLLQVLQRHELLLENAKENHKRKRELTFTPPWVDEVPIDKIIPKWARFKMIVWCKHKFLPRPKAIVPPVEPTFSSKSNPNLRRP